MAESHPSPRDNFSPVPDELHQMIIEMLIGEALRFLELRNDVAWTLTRLAPETTRRCSISFSSEQVVDGRPELAQLKELRL